VSGFALHPDAFADLDEIWEFIAADNIAAADRVIGEVFATVRTLAASRHIGHRRPDLTNKPLRFFRVRDYLVAYAPDEDPLWVIAVIHGRRNPRVMAAILRGRDE
jgi:plasmid stabilization system protein ParE